MLVVVMEQPDLVQFLLDREDARRLHEINLGVKIDSLERRLAGVESQLGLLVSLQNQGPEQVALSQQLKTSADALTATVAIAKG
jgi:hypothetical protein